MSQFNSWSEAMEVVDSMLDSEQMVEIADTVLNPSEVLKGLRPTDYRTYLYDWIDAQGEYDTDEWDDLNLVP